MDMAQIKDDIATIKDMILNLSGDKQKLQKNWKENKIRPN